MANRIWQHKTSGDRHVVTVDEHGVVEAATDAVSDRDICLADLGDWEPPTEHAAWFNAHADEFRELDDQEILAIEAASQEITE